MKRMDESLRRAAEAGRVRSSIFEALGPGDLYLVTCEEHDAQRWVSLQAECPSCAGPGLADERVNVVALADEVERLRAKVQRLRVGETRPAEIPPLTTEMVVDLLWLASVEVDEATVESWTAEQREEAADWAGAVHLQASDHDDVKVPPVPGHVKKLHGAPVAGPWTRDLATDTWSRSQAGRTGDLARVDWDGETQRWCVELRDVEHDDDYATARQAMAAADRVLVEDGYAMDGGVPCE